MNHLNISASPFNDPYRQNWTILALLEHLAVDDARIDEADPQLLRRIDEALGGGSRWEGAPGAMALVRSIAAALRKDPGAAERRIADLLATRPERPAGRRAEPTGRAA